jgi:hypothetical protein
MVKELAEILGMKLAPLPFIQVLAGLAQVVTQTDNDGAGGMVVSRYPVSYNTNIPSNAEYTPERALIPDSSKASIVYFEDFGGTQGTNRGRFQTFTQRLRLVMWYNKEILFSSAEQYKHSNAVFMAKIIETLTKDRMFNYEVFKRVNISVASIPPLDAGIFGRYSYDETTRQYLRPPFDFFAIDLAINFEIDGECI